MEIDQRKTRLDLRASITTYLAICILSFSLISCDSNLLFEENLKVSDAKWHRNESARFNFIVEDTLSEYDLYLNVRHGGDYPYKNLYLFTKTSSPNGLVSVDTAQMIFADNQGRWLGKGIGGIFDYQFKYKERIVFPAKGEYTFEIEQAMREMELDNVTDIGIRIEKRVE